MYQIANLKKGVKVLLYGVLPLGFLSIFKKNSPELKYRKYFVKHGYTRHPYTFAQRYVEMPIEVFKDSSIGLQYVLHRSGQKLYYPRSYDVAAIRKSYKAVLIEQDIQHPHHYVDSLGEFKGKVFLDIGTAEGFTSLDVVDVAEQVYMFECDPRWVEALRATFEPWKEKVTIIEKFVSSVCDEKRISLDDFFKDKPTENLFLKIDVEGAECDVLNGARQLFSKVRNINFAVCTYHRANDAKKIMNYLREYQYTWNVPQELFYVKHSFRICLLKG